MKDFVKGVFTLAVLVLFALWEFGETQLVWLESISSNVELFNNLFFVAFISVFLLSTLGCKNSETLSPLNFKGWLLVNFITFSVFQFYMELIALGAGINLYPRLNSASIVVLILTFLISQDILILSFRKEKE